MHDEVSDTSACFCTEFSPPLVCNTKKSPTGKKELSSTLYFTQSVQLTTSLLCGKKSFFIRLYGPILYLFRVFVCQLYEASSPFPIGGSIFLVQSSRIFPQVSIPHPTLLLWPAQCLSLTVTAHHTQIQCMFLYL